LSTLVVFTNLKLFRVMHHLFEPCGGLILMYDFLHSPNMLFINDMCWLFGLTLMQTREIVCADKYSLYDV